MKLITLGGLRLDSGEIRPKPLLLLTYLALEGPQPRARLAKLFFPDSKDAADALSTTLRRLRELGDAISEQNGFLSIPVQCDAVEFEDFLNLGRHEEAITSYQGMFLDGVDVSLAEELEEWVYQTRERLAAKVRQAYITLAEASEGKRLIGYIEASLKIKAAPELESYELRRLYNLAKRIDEGLKKTLEQEAQSLGINLSLRHNIPASLTSFVGRKDALASVMSRLQEGRLITLHGMGGVGKTRLSLEVASLCIQKLQYPDGVFFVSLEQVTDQAQLISAIAEALDMTLNPMRPLLEQLQNVLSNKHLLLILDNFETITPAAKQLLPLLKSCPELRILVTSRERLSVEGEWVVPLTGLSLPTQEVSSGEALRLFEVRAKRLES